MPDQIKVRKAEYSDIPRLVEVENTAWKEAGTEVYTTEHFQSWLDIYPDGFLVLTKNGIIQAFGFVFQFYFDEENPTKLSTFDNLTDNGFATKVHDPKGNRHFGITHCSLKEGLGHILLKHTIEFCFSTGKPGVGVSRIPGFKKYIDEIKTTKIFENITPELEYQIAVSYVHECATMIGEKMKIKFSKTFPKNPNITRLPKLKKADPVLRKYMYNPNGILCTLLPNFIEDTKSRNFSVLLDSEIL